ncbi:putative kinetochore protein spc24 [Saitoella coloradoensis]
MESPTALIQQTIAGFQTSSDLSAIARIQDGFHDIAESRERRRDETRLALKELSRALALEKSTYDSLVNSPSREEHASSMLAADRQKFSLAKSINDVESELQSEEAKLQRLKDELIALEQEDPSDDSSAKAAADNIAVLKLRVYRSLGIDLEEDGAGGFAKAHIRTLDNKDVRPLNIENKYGKYFSANNFWDFLSL